MKITQFGPDGLPDVLGAWSTGVYSLNSNTGMVDGGLSSLNFVQLITANGSNALLRPIVNFAAGSNIFLSLDADPSNSVPSNTIRIHGSAGSTGVSGITSNGSNSLAGTVNLQAGTNIALGVSGSTITITDIGASSSGGGGSTGNYTFITEFDLGSDTADFDFTSIAGTYRHLQLLWWGRGAKSADFDQVRVQFNGDTASNYDSSLIDSGSLADAIAATTSAQIGDVAAATSTANFAAAGTLTLPFYADTSFFKVFNASGYMRYDANQFSWSGGGIWHSTAAITRVRLFPLGGNWLSGSRCALYGIT